LNFAVCNNGSLTFVLRYFGSRKINHTEIEVVVEILAKKMDDI